MPLPTPLMMVDWHADGLPAGGNGSIAVAAGATIASEAGLTIASMTSVTTDEDVTGRVLRDAGITAERGRNQIKSLSPPIANDLQTALNNLSGDYSPANPASPLYPLVDVGRDARWTYLYGGTAYGVVRGYLDVLNPQPEWGTQAVDIAALSQLARLVRRDGFSSPLYGDGTLANAIRTDQALGYVFDAAGLTDPTLRAFDVGQTKLLWFWISPEDELFDLALRIWASEGPGARLYDGADGKTYFKQRYAQLTEPRSTTPQATYRDTAPEPYYVSWQPDSGEQNVVNVCSVTWKRRLADAADTPLWQFGAVITLAAGESRSFQIRPSTADPIGSIVAPVLSTDYTVSAGSLASATFDRTSGPFVTLTLVAGAGGATVAGPTADPTTGIQVRGRLARVTATTQVTNTIDTSASRARYGPKPYTLGTLAEIDFNTLQDFTNAVVGQNQTPRPLRTVEVPLVTDTNLVTTLPREIGDRVRIVNARESFDREMLVEYVRHEWPPTGVPRAFLGCEAAVNADWGFWDQGLWDVALWTY
jgi:hypothetical protein